MKNFKLLLFCLALVCFSCTVQEMESPKPEKVVHITSDDIICKDGVFQLGITLDEAKKRGISEVEYLRIENDIRAFNEYNNSMSQEIVTRSDDEGYIIVFHQIWFGSLSFDSLSTSPDSDFYSGFPDGDYRLEYMFSSDIGIINDLGVFWGGGEGSYITSLGPAIGERDYDGQGNSLGLTYSCNGGGSGICFWKLYYKIRIPADQFRVPFDVE